MNIMELYLNQFDRVKELYNYNPQEGSSFWQRMDFLDSTSYENRRELVEILTEYNQNLGCSDLTKENLRKFSDKKTLTVVTGQQAGILTGPLYTIYKACTAIILAKDLSEKLQRYVIPVFWIATEDHDYQEINHIFLSNVKGRPRKSSLKGQPMGKPSVGDIPIPKDWENLIRELSYHTPETKDKKRVLELIKETVEKSENLGEWFGRLMTAIFRDYGLIFVDPMLKELRKLQKRGMHIAVESNDEINKMIDNKTSIFSELGLEKSIKKQSSKVNLFFYQENDRISIVKKDNTNFCLQNNLEESFKKGDLAELIESEPWKFSPNVVLRPIFQDLLFPTLCYVGGPGEIAYYSQLKDVYPYFGLEMPIIYPRKSLTIIEPRVSDRMQKHNLNYEQVTKDSNQLLENYLHNNLPVDIDIEMEAFIEQVEGDYSDLLEKFLLIDENIESIGEKNLARIKYQLEYLRNKAWQKHRKNNKEVIEDFAMVQNALKPFNKPQERVYNTIPFLINHGLEFIDKLIKESQIEDFNHQVLMLGDEGYAKS